MRTWAVTEGQESWDEESDMGNKKEVDGRGGGCQEEVQGSGRGRNLGGLLGF